MRILALLALILALAGCHMLRPELPPWARPVPAKSEPAPEAPPEAEASVVPEPATTPAPPPAPEPAPAPVTPPPPPPPPAVAPAPAGPPPPPVRAATPPAGSRPGARARRATGPGKSPVDRQPAAGRGATVTGGSAARDRRYREAPPSTGEPAAGAEGPGDTTAGAGARRAGQEGSRWTGVRAGREPGGEGSNARGRSQHPPLNLLRRVTFYILPQSTSVVTLTSR